MAGENWLIKLKICGGVKLVSEHKNIWWGKTG